MSQETHTHRTCSVSRAASAAEPTREVPPSHTDEPSILGMPGEMPSMTLQQPTPHRVASVTNPTAPQTDTADTSFLEVKEMTRIISQQATEITGQVTNLSPGPNPMQTIATALRNSLTAFHRRTEQEIGRTLKATEALERAIRAQAPRIEDTRARSGDAQTNSLHAFQMTRTINETTTQIVEVVKQLSKDLSSQIAELSSVSSRLDGARGLIYDHGKGLREVQEQISAMAERMVVHQGEPEESEGPTRSYPLQAPIGREAPLCQGQGRTKRKPEEPEGPTRVYPSQVSAGKENPLRQQEAEEPLVGDDDDDLYGPGPSGFLRESMAKPISLSRKSAQTRRDENSFVNQTTAEGNAIPKEARTKRPEPFNGKKGKEGETFLLRMQIYFSDYDEGTFNDNRKIRTTLMNMEAGEAASWAQPFLRRLIDQEEHEYLESWESFKKNAEVCGKA